MQSIASARPLRHLIASFWCSNWRYSRYQELVSVHDTLTSSVPLFTAFSDPKRVSNTSWYSPPVPHIFLFRPLMRGTKTNFCTLTTVIFPRALQASRKEMRGMHLQETKPGLRTIQLVFGTYCYIASLRHFNCYIATAESKQPFLPRGSSFTGPSSQQPGTTTTSGSPRRKADQFKPRPVLDRS